MAAKVQGADKVLANLARIKKGIGTKIVAGALREPLKARKAELAAAAPVGTGPLEEGQQHGTIKKFLKIKAMKRKKGRIGVQLVVRATPRADTPYWASFTNQGTVNQPAQHWGNEVFKKNVDSDRKTIEKNIRINIENEVK